MSISQRLAAILGIGLFAMVVPGVANSVSPGLGEHFVFLIPALLLLFGIYAIFKAGRLSVRPEDRR